MRRVICFLVLIWLFSLFQYSPSVLHERESFKVAYAEPLFGTLRRFRRLFSFGRVWRLVIAGVAFKAEQSITSKIGEEIQRKTGNLVNWSCYGVNGDRLKDLLTRVHSIPEFDGNLVVVSVGVNDVTRLTSLKAWRRDLRALINKLRGRFDRLLFLGLPPMEDFPILPFPSPGLRASIQISARQRDEIFDDVFILNIMDAHQTETWLRMAITLAR